MELNKKINIIGIGISSINKSKATHVTGRGGPYCCGMLRISHYLDNRFTHGGKFVSSTHRPRSAPQEQYFFFLLLVFIFLRG
jgi:hypothetical protein